MESNEVRYLNTDLEIESAQDLTSIVAEFGEDVFVLHHGVVRGFQHASFAPLGNSVEADEAINYFCGLVEQFPAEVREVWDNCCSRILDIGYQSGTAPVSFRSELRQPTVQRAAQIGAAIVITIYPLQTASGSGQPANT